MAPREAPSQKTYALASPRVSASWTAEATVRPSWPLPSSQLSFQVAPSGFHSDIHVLRPVGSGPSTGLAYVWPVWVFTQRRACGSASIAAVYALASRQPNESQQATRTPLAIGPSTLAKSAACRGVNRMDAYVAV